MPELTASQVKKAGRILRRYMRGEISDPEEWDSALNCILAYRRGYSAPMLSANNSLRYFVQKLGLDAQVSQRLKRMGTILEKVVREPTLALDRMQDWGGCRVVLPDVESVYRLADRVAETRGRKLIGLTDYIETPRVSGYRGIHLISYYGHDPHPIEVQIRTRNMHAWATSVEELSSIMGANYKQDGDGPLHKYMECMSRMFAHVDAGEPIPSELLTERDILLATVSGTVTQELHP